MTTSIVHPYAYRLARLERLQRWRAENGPGPWPCSFDGRCIMGGVVAHDDPAAVITTEGVSHPECIEELRLSQQRMARRTNARRATCADCGKVSSPGAIASHRRHAHPGGEDE